MIQFKCEHCGATIRVSDDAMGKFGDCPKCGKKVKVPAPDQSEAIALSPEIPASGNSSDAIAAAAAAAMARGASIPGNYVARPRLRGHRAGWFTEFAMFSTMIAPALIKAIFWVGAVLCVVAAIVGIIYPLVERGEITAVEILTALGLLIFGPLVLRLYCEVAIVLFCIHEELVRIRKSTEGS